MFNRKTEKTIDSKKNDRRFPAEYPPTSGGISGIGTIKCKQGSTMEKKKKLLIVRHKNQVLTSNYVDHPTPTSLLVGGFLFYFIFLVRELWFG